MSEPCTEASTATDIVADVPAIKVLLDSALPRAWGGAAAADAELPWPPEA